MEEDQRKVRALVSGDEVDMDGLLEMLNAKMGRHIQAYNQALTGIPLDQRPRGREWKSGFEVSGLYASFVLGGRNVFQMSPVLAAQLDHAELDDVHVQDVRLPHEFFWVSLDGLDCGGLPGPPNVIDGAYVGKEGEGLSITVTSRRLDVGPYHGKAAAIPDPIFRVPCKFEEDENPSFDEVINRAIESGDIELRREAATKGIAMPGREPVASENGSPVYSQVIQTADGPKSMLLTDVSRVNDLREIEDRNSAMPKVRRAVQLVVNFLAFMSLTPEEISVRLDWVDDAPPKLLDAARKSKKTRDINIANEKLAHAGFNRIKVVSYRPSPQTKHVEGGGRELEFGHRRKTHLRMQAYGPNMSLRKMIWVQSARVRPDLPLNPNAKTRTYVAISDDESHGTDVTDR
jgi:hypothetical protein